MSGSGDSSQARLMGFALGPSRVDGCVAGTTDTSGYSLQGSRSDSPGHPALEPDTQGWLLRPSWLLLSLSSFRALFFLGVHFFLCGLGISILLSQSVKIKREPVKGVAGNVICVRMRKSSCGRGL